MDMQDTRLRINAAMPFAVLALVSIVAGGAIAAATAHAPSQPLVWLVAYLVLVVGVAQGVFGVGQAWLARQPPPPRRVALQIVVFNAANAAVISGSLASQFVWVVAGTLFFAVAMALFALGVRRGRKGAWLWAYRALLMFLLVSSLVGLVLSLLRHGF